jgi:hypothetical protein
MMASQSASFMRISRLSRVMPALLTRMLGAPPRPSATAASVASMELSVTSSRRPSTLAPVAGQFVLDALGAGVGGRRAGHRGALLQQSLRDGATDTAARAGHQCNLAVKHVSSPPALVQADAVEHRQRLRCFVDALAEPVSTLPGPASMASGRPDRQSLHGLHPAHRAVELLGSSPRRSLHRARRAHSHCAEPGLRRRRQLDLGEPLGQCIGGLAHQRAMRGHAHRQHQARLAPAAWRGDGAFHGVRCAGDDDLARRVEVDRLQYLAPRPARAEVGGPDRRRARADAAIAPCPRHGLLHQSRALGDQPTASAKSRGAAQTSAVYSPRLWPAIAAGIGAVRACQQRHTATPARASPAVCSRFGPRTSFGAIADQRQRSRPRASEASREGLGDLRKRRRQLGEHADGLRALTGKQKREAG